MIRLITVLMMMFALGCVSARAQIDMEARIGYDGVVLNGRWFPLEVCIVNDDEAFTGEIAVNLQQSETEYDRYIYPVSVGAGETKTVRFPISTLIPQLVFEVELCQGDEVAACERVAARKAIDDEALLAGMLGGDESIHEAFSTSAQNNVLGRQETMTAVSLDKQLASISREELNAFGLLVVAGDAKLNKDAIMRMEQWVYEGGWLIAEGDAALISAMGMKPAQPALSSDSALKALHRFANMPHEEDLPLKVTPLEEEEAVLVTDEEGHCILAGRKYGQGYILTAGFSLEDPVVLTASKDQAFWQRILIAADQTRYNELFRVGHRRNYTFGSMLNEKQVIDEGKSILPVLIQLGIYMCICGFGWFIWLGRCDRTGLMWLLLPVSACAGVALMIAASGVMDFNEPTAASFRVTHYDEQGHRKTEERALVAYGDMKPVTLTGEPSAPIERAEYGFFHSGMEASERALLRDTVYLGDLPGITLSETAPWKTRNLVIKTPLEPEGSVTGLAWMEEDGLHASIVNATDAELRDVYLFTELGYTHLGDLGIGETADAFIAETKEPRKNEDGTQMIVDGVLLEYPVSLYSVIDASVYQGEVDEAELTAEEKQRLNIESAKRSLVSGKLNESLLPCMIYAQTPGIPCVQLLKDGEPIKRHAQISMLTAQAAFDVKSESGYVYYPKGTFKAHNAACDEGKPVMGGEAEKHWYSDMSEDLVFAFDLSEMEGVELLRIKIISEAYMTGDEAMHVEVYDNELESFVRMPQAGNCTLSGDILRRAIGSENRLFIRYAAAPEQSVSVSLPQIIAEGSVRP